MQVKEKPAIYNVDDKPGQGIYECIFCFLMIKLGFDEKLPVCGYCEKNAKTKYIKTEF